MSARPVLLRAAALSRQEVLAAGVLAAMVALGAKLAVDAAAMPSRPLVFSLGGRGFPGGFPGRRHRPTSLLVLRNDGAPG